MAYFIPSFFQKRLLRYALSRLEILDTDALGLDNLDIAWGQRSTVELRDVGLKMGVCMPLLYLLRDESYTLSSPADDIHFAEAFQSLETSSGVTSCGSEDTAPAHHRSGRYL